MVLAEAGEPSADTLEITLTLEDIYELIMEKCDILLAGDVFQTEQAESEACGPFCMARKGRNPPNEGDDELLQLDCENSVRARVNLSFKYGGGENSVSVGNVYVGVDGTLQVVNE